MGELAIVRAREKAEKTLEANGAEGISDIEGKVARVATSELGNERVSISRCHRQARWTDQPPRLDALACKTNGRDPRGQTRGVKGWRWQGGQHYGWTGTCLGWRPGTEIGDLGKPGRRAITN